MYICYMYVYVCVKCMCYMCIYVKISILSLQNSFYAINTIGGDFQSPLASYDISACVNNATVK